VSPRTRKKRFDIREASGKIVVAGVVLLLANLAVAVLLVHPKVLKVHQLSDESSPQRQEIRSREHAVAKREAYLGALEKAQDGIQHFASDVLSTRQKRMIGVQLEVTKLLKEFGIAFDRVQYENETIEDGTLERFGIVVPLAGGYSNLRKFIQAVESSQNFLVIERVSLGTGKTGDIVDLNITLATYFMASDADLEDIGKRAPQREKAS
jgi:Tfp pilus assembly protein PilO